MTVLMTMKCDVAEWLLQAYRSQWLAMLKVDNGTDLGFVGWLTALGFLRLSLLAVFDNCMLWGRLSVWLPLLYLLHWLIVFCHCFKGCGILSLRNRLLEPERVTSSGWFLVTLLTGCLEWHSHLACMSRLQLSADFFSLTWQKCKTSIWRLFYSCQSSCWLPSFSFCWCIPFSSFVAAATYCTQSCNIWLYFCG